METPLNKSFKHPIHERLEAIRLYKEGYNSVQIGEQMKITPNVILTWLNHYKVYGVAGLQKCKREHLSGKFKVKVVRDILKNSISCGVASIKYNVSETAVRSWKKKVNAGGYDALRFKKKRASKSENSDNSIQQEFYSANINKLKEKNKQLKAEIAKLKRMGVLNSIATEA